LPPAQWKAISARFIPDHPIHSSRHSTDCGGEAMKEGTIHLSPPMAEFVLTKSTAASDRSLFWTDRPRNPVTLAGPNAVVPIAPVPMICLPPSGRRSPLGLYPRDHSSIPTDGRVCPYQKHGGFGSEFIRRTTVQLVLKTSWTDRPRNPVTLAGPNAVVPIAPVPMICLPPSGTLGGSVLGIGTDSAGSVECLLL
jgi:hypothetical protein